MAAKRCDALLELGDVDGQRVWKGVLRAVEELVRVGAEGGREGELMSAEEEAKAAGTVAEFGTRALTTIDKAGG